MTKLEKDEVLMETGRDYNNFPRTQEPNPLTKSFPSKFHFEC